MTSAVPPVPKGQQIWLDLMPLFLAAMPLARELVVLVADAVESARAEDVSLEQIDAMLARIEEKNTTIQNMVAEIRASRS